MEFRVNNSEKVRIDINGNVGIGTTNPSLGVLQISRIGQSNMVIQGDKAIAPGLTPVIPGLTPNWTGVEKWFIGRDGTGGTDKLIFRRSGATIWLLIPPATSASGRLAVAKIGSEWEYVVYNGRQRFLSTAGTTYFKPKARQYQSNSPINPLWVQPRRLASICTAK